MFKSEEIHKFLNHEFDFSNQHKDTYDDWLKAFSKSVKDRAEKDCIIGLSSGYDSGALMSELNNLEIPYKAYIIPANEDKGILEERMKLVIENNDYEMEDLSPEKFIEYKKFLNKKIENSKYIIKYNGIETDMRILDDRASMGGAFMCDTAKKEGRTLYLSTQGADEIISDYSLIPAQSTYKGVFPEDLKEWENFKKGCNYSYMMKEERVAGAYGIEVRYPFLDIDLVQEYLWLKAELKNRNYKAPLHEYLIKYSIPFEQGVKRGFAP